MQILTHKKNIVTLFAALILLSAAAILNAEPLDTIPKSLESRMAVKHYKSFSAGMEISYSNNSSLKQFIEYELPNYPYIADDDKLKEFSSGLGFFGSGELQVSKRFSARLDYTYFIKSYNSSADFYSSYDFTYYSHEIYLKGYLLCPVDYVLFKLGAGAGFIHSTFNTKYYSVETNYTSNGLGLTLEGVMDVQISKNVAGYLSGGITNTFQTNLKSSGGDELKAKNGNSVNLNSFGAALRIGLEVFIF